MNSTKDVQTNIKHMVNKPDLNGDSRYDYSDITDLCDYPYIGGQKQGGRKHRTLSEEEIERLTY